MARVVAFIPVRGESRAIPLKNIKEFCGKPLVHWSIESLANAVSVDKIIIATDSDQIKESVEQLNISKTEIYSREAENAKDTSSTESVMLEYIEKTSLKEDTIFILVQATSPFTQTKDFELALKQYKENGSDSMLTCCNVKRFFWNPDGTPKNYDYNQRPRRQDFSGTLMETGAFYINTVKNIKKSQNRLSGKIGIYEMPEYTGVELDSEWDWIIAENIMYHFILNPGDLIVPDIKVFLMDLDGVLTDGGMYYSPGGEEMKKFNTIDGHGLELLRNAGIKTGILTKENNEINAHRAKKLSIDYFYQGAIDKVKLANEICQKENVSLKEVSYIGDDENDIPLLNSVGLAACPINATKNVKRVRNIIRLNNSGGNGAVREFAELILSKKAK